MHDMGQTQDLGLLATKMPACKGSDFFPSLFIEYAPFPLSLWRKTDKYKEESKTRSSKDPG